jgi:hypothetical protein
LKNKKQKAQSGEISPFVSKWIGILKTKKTYKKLRDDVIYKLQNKERFLTIQGV